jgi:hypothetical protein
LVAAADDDDDDGDDDGDDGVDGLASSATTTIDSLTTAAGAGAGAESPNRFPSNPLKLPPLLLLLLLLLLVVVGVVPLVLNIDLNIVSIGFFLFSSATAAAAAAAATSVLCFSINLALCPASPRSRSVVVVRVSPEMGLDIYTMVGSVYKISSDINCPPTRAVIIPMRVISDGNDSKIGPPLPVPEPELVNFKESGIVIATFVGAAGLPAREAELTDLTTRSNTVLFVNPEYRKG